MTRLIHYKAPDIVDLSNEQQHMMADLADSCNAMYELRRMTPEQMVIVLERLVAIIQREEKK